MKKLIYLALLLSFGATDCFAENESTEQTTIKRLISYNQYGDGDVIFTVNNPSSNCYGYWITKSDAGFDANFSVILAAYHAKATVKVYGLNHIKWSGSGNFWCKIYAIENTR